MLTMTQKLPGGLETEEVVSVDINALLDDSRAQFVKEAAEVLGYTSLLEEYERAHAAEILNAALVSAGIRRVFSAESVERYQAYEVAKVRKSQPGLGRFSVYWGGDRLGEYAGQIPEAALMAAILIKRANPHIKVLVEHLTVASRGTDDPFLMVELAGQQRYIAVWDEKGYIPSYQAVENK